MAQGPAQGPQPATLLSLHLAGWWMAGLFTAWMVLLVKTQTVSVSKTLSSLLSPFPSHPPVFFLSPFPSHPPLFSSRVAHKELYFAEKVSYVHTYLHLLCPFWSVEVCRGKFDSPLLQKTCRTDCCRNCLKLDLRKRINPECLMPIMCWNWIGRATVHISICEVMCFGIKSR